MTYRVSTADMPANTSAEKLLMPIELMFLRKVSSDPLIVYRALDTAGMCRCVPSKELMHGCFVRHSYKALSQGFSMPTFVSVMWALWAVRHVWWDRSVCTQSGTCVNKCMQDVRAHICEGSVAVLLYKNHPCSRMCTWRQPCSRMCTWHQPCSRMCTWHQPSHACERDICTWHQGLDSWVLWRCCISWYACTCSSTCLCLVHTASCLDVDFYIDSWKRVH